MTNKLVASHDEQVAAIACFDLEESVRHYQNGRMVAKRVSAKDLVMPMIGHENAELQRHALQCVSKTLVQNGQHVSSTSYRVELSYEKARIFVTTVKKEVLLLLFHQPLCTKNSALEMREQAKRSRSWLGDKNECNRSIAPIRAWV